MDDFIFFVPGYLKSYGKMSWEIALVFTCGVFQLMRSCRAAVVHWLACESTAPKSFCSQLVWVEEKEEGVKLVSALHCISVVYTYQNKLFELLLLLFWLDKGLQTTTLRHFNPVQWDGTQARDGTNTNSCIAHVCASSVCQPIWTNLVKFSGTAVSWNENFAFLMSLWNKGLSIPESLSGHCSSAEMQKRTC